MPVRATYYAPAASTLVASVRRLSDGLLLDFGDGTFKANPGTPTTPLVEGSGIYAGEYRLTIASTSANVWTDGDYVLGIHEGGIAVDGLPFVMLRGDDASRPDPLTNPKGTAYANDTLGKMLQDWDRYGVSLTVQGGTPTTGHFNVAVTSPATPAAAFVGQSALFRTGALAGLRRTVSAYDATTRLLTVDTPFPSAPAAGDVLQVF